ncbi:MAG: lysophospholipid acyltransferase family protein [Candidatus Baltobacteraceae bacterium]
MILPVYRFVAWLVKVLLQIFWRFRVVDAEKVPLAGPVILACNHVSYFDPPVLGCALRRPVRYMAKQELFTIPLLGPFIRALGAYPVDRSRHTGAAVKRSLEMLQTGAAIGIFPEGTRNLDGSVKPHVGAALLASKSGAAVVPAWVDGTAQAGRFHRIAVIYGDPIRFDPAQKASREDLAKWTEEIMARIHALRGALGDDSKGGKTRPQGGTEPSS